MLTSPKVYVSRHSLSGRYDVHTNFTYSFQSRDYVNPVRVHGLKEDIEKKPELADIDAKIP